ncbi:MAG: hypothetical protein ACT4P5_08405, partial [Armatimonadota bacterium]
MDRFNRLRLRRFGFLAILLAIAVLMVVFGLGPRALRLAARDPGAAALPDEYRYRFQRASRGSVTRALEQEIAFYQERVRRDPQGGLDLASLAGTYLGMARATGDLSWY